MEWVPSQIVRFAIDDPVGRLGFSQAFRPPIEILRFAIGPDRIEEAAASQHTRQLPLMSGKGQSQKCRHLRKDSASPRQADISEGGWQVGLAP